jgi:hypothetical protein
MLAPISSYACADEPMAGAPHPSRAAFIDGDAMTLDDTLWLLFAAVTGAAVACGIPWGAMLIARLVAVRPAATRRRSARRL